MCTVFTCWCWLNSFSMQIKRVEIFFWLPEKGGGGVYILHPDKTLHVGAKRNLLTPQGNTSQET